MSTKCLRRPTLLHVGLTTLHSHVGFATLPMLRHVRTKLHEINIHTLYISRFTTLLMRRLHISSLCSRFSNATFAQACKLKLRQPRRCLARCAAARVSWIFSTKRVENICTVPSGGPPSRISRILSERLMDTSCLSDGARLRVT